jgi:hypothetical protein
MAANTNIQLTALDFDTLKTNFLGYLQQQSTFQDYNFQGSALNTLVDLMVYNTQYNAYYLNMVANEMFLDSAVQRGSVISHAKLLNYVPNSATAPSATVNIIFNNVNSASLTLPAYSVFSSSAINGVNYTFVNTNAYTVNTVNKTATFSNVTIKQGVPANYNFTVDSTSNPNYIFEIPDNAIDTSTLQVIVQNSSTDSTQTTFNLSSDYLGLDGTSQVYFLQEAVNGNYQIYFGDGIIGQQLVDGNIVYVGYLSTEGTGAAGANSFILLQSVSGYAATTVDSVTPATTGTNKESIDSIKFQAPKTFSAQGRAVTTDDYITLIQKNNLGITFDAVNVWGGQYNDPPSYGKVFVCIKPNGSYSLTSNQKDLILNSIINPISVITVEPVIVDPDYNYVQVICNVLYDQRKTSYTSGQIETLVKTAINNYSIKNLNTFNSTFSSSDLITSISNTDASIIANEISIKVQKKIYPILGQPTTYKLNFGTSLQRNLLTSGINSTVACSYIDQDGITRTGVYIEEVPSPTGGVSSISITNSGYSYLYAPTVTILGDGSGATAYSVLNTDGSINSIVITNAGSGYTQAIVTLTSVNGDGGQGATAIAILQGAIGTLRTYYNDSTGVKTILNSNIGTVDYNNGIITLTGFGPQTVDGTTGQLTIAATPVTTIISSSTNRIITLDQTDSGSIIVNVTAK